ncbi:MAG: hypothetical protein ABJL99_12520 [Aliishimia sp.]
MFSLIHLILPTLFPSWRFFEDVGPSPRIDFRLLREGTATQWRDAIPRPERVSPFEAICRLFWNRHRNESLYLTSCSERLIVEPTDHTLAQINTRLMRRHGQVGAQIQFRLRLITRDEDRIDTTIAYESEPVHVV